MTRVSSKKLKTKTGKGIEHNLALLLTKFKTKEEQISFLGDFLSPSEKIMLSKRLAIIFMILQNYSFLQIAKTLKVSESTILRYWKELKQDKHKELKKILLAVKKDKGFLSDLEKILNFGMSPKYRIRRKWFDKVINK
jgi:Trp operon repressor